MMHRALATADLAHMICLHLEDDKTELARLARTNEVFNGTATSVLWKSLNTIIPLLKLFPNEIVFVSKSGAIVSRVDAL
jgi:hypothetical protein